MTEQGTGEREVPMDARRAIERAVWDWGVQGDSCALLAAQVLEALNAAGYELTAKDGAA